MSELLQPPPVLDISILSLTSEFIALLGVGIGSPISLAGIVEPVKKIDR